MLKLQGPFLERIHRTSTIGAFALGVLVVFVFVGLLTATVRVSGEQDSVVVGVKVGDWVKYGTTRLGTPRAWAWEDVEWVKVEVLNISDTTVTIRETLHYDDGDEYVRNSSISLGHSGVYDYSKYIIAANLEPRDKVGEVHVWVERNKGVYVDLTLNDTDYRSYGGVTREVNQLKWLNLEEDPIIPGLLINRTYERYWDKDTGFLLECKVQTYLIGYKEYYETHPSSTYKLEIVDTNMWEMEKPPQQPPWWLVTIPIGSVIAVAVVFKLRNNTKKNKADKQ